MEIDFLNVVLFYTLASCGFLLAAFFRFRDRPGRYLLMGAWTIGLHIVYKLMWICFADGQQYEPPVPFGLVYPVLLYLRAHTYYRPAKEIPTWINGVFVLPLLFHLCLFTFVTLQHEGDAGAIWYSKIYYASVMLSLVVLSVLTTRLYSSYTGPSTPTDILIRQLTMLCYGLVAFVYITWYQVSIPKSEIGFEVRPMIFLFLAMGFAVVVRYLTANKRDSRNDRRENLINAPANEMEREEAIAKLPEPVAARLAKVIERELNDAKLFLNPAVSLDMLAERTGIPRHQLSQVFNGYYKKSFYQFIAAARIEYAIGQISEMGDTMTLDSLSYECGFNSKTSFNRYFKEYMGMTPSEYRSIRCESLHVQ
ncbi:helix-turn-helix domain-containing protein [Parapedobacter sp. GCM10030251]|uniref:helix-turn-helix domain-containing protein n=1 Tax=Parapedobacter sp. GCM10030251 TaxID=3273419 RepID=UPI0036145F43